MIDSTQLAQWSEWSKRDDWHTRFVSSDIRQMLGEIERLRETLSIVKNWLENSQPRGYETPLDIIQRAMDGE